MVELIGLVTIGALVWLLAWSMAGESDAERRRTSSGGGHQEPAVRPAIPKRRAA